MICQKCGQMEMEYEINNTLIAVKEELKKAVKEFAAFNSAHEGYAVILEELDELKAEVWKKPATRNKELMRENAIQVAAMAVRFVIDLLSGKPDEIVR